MTVQERWQICRFIEQMERRQAFSDRLRLENRSTYHGYPIHDHSEKERK